MFLILPMKETDLGIAFRTSKPAATAVEIGSSDAGVCCLLCTLAPPKGPLAPNPHILESVFVCVCF